MLPRLGREQSLEQVNVDTPTEFSLYHELAPLIQIFNSPSGSK